MVALVLQKLREICAAYCLIGIATCMWIGAPQLQASTIRADAPIWFSIEGESIIAGKPFWLNVHVGEAAIPVDSLFGLSFVVRYSDSSLVSVVPPDTASLRSGPFLQNPKFLAVWEPEESGIAIGMTRVAGDGGISGDGVVARLRLIAKETASDSIPLSFSLAEIRAQEEDGDPISLDARAAEFIVTLPEGFRIAITPRNARVVRGETAQFGVRINSIGGFKGTVALATSPQVDGIQASLAETNVAAGDSTLLELRAEAQAIPSAYTFFVDGSADTLAHSDSLLLEIASVPLAVRAPDEAVPSSTPFDIQLALGSERDPITDLASLEFNLRYDPAIWLTLDALPDSAVVLSEWVADDFEMSASADTIAGSLNVRMQLRSDGTPASGFGELLAARLVAGLQTPDQTRIRFSLENIEARNSAGDAIYLSAVPDSIVISETVDYLIVVEPRDLQIIAGQQVRISAALLASPSFDSFVQLSVLGAPALLEVGFEQDSLDRNQTLNGFVRADSTLLPGDYQFNVVGTSGELVRQQAVRIQVQPFSDFQLVISPSMQAIFANDSTTFTISVLTEEDDLGDVQLSLSPESRRGWMQAVFLPPVLRANSSGTLTLIASEDAPIGAFGFTVVAQTSRILREASATLEVLKPPPPVRPNPFTPNNDGYNDVLTFDYSALLNAGGRVAIYDMSGRKIRELVGERRWNGLDEEGREVQPGAYLYVVLDNNGIIAKGVVGLAK